MHPVVDGLAAMEPDDLAAPYECTITKRCSVEESSDHQQEDRLSKLPDDILLIIFENLVIHDAVKTSVLSKRWRHLTAMLSRIALDASSFHPLNKAEVTMDDVARSNRAVIEATKSILERESHHTIDFLGISFYTRDEAIDIVRSVDEAMANREVVYLYLSFNADVVSPAHALRLAYGTRFMTFFDACPRAFGGLSALHISHARFDVSDIPNVLNACKKLEDLCLEDCDTEILSVLQIEHPQLRVLEIKACDFKMVELSWLPRLEKLTFSRWIPSKDQYPLSLGYVPQLWTLTLIDESSTLHKTFVLSDLLANATIELLDVDFMCRRIWIQPESPKVLPSPFRNLVAVRLHRIHDQCDLTWTMFLLQAACRLKRIYIEAWDHIHDEEAYTEYAALWHEIYQKDCDNDLSKWEVPDDFIHYHLRTITISGFQVEERFMRYIKRVMTAAVNLEMIRLFDSMICGRCRFHPSTSYPQTSKERDEIRMNILDQRSTPVKIEFGT